MTIQYAAIFFAIEVLIAEFIFLKKCVKRKLFYLRLLGVCAVIIACAALVPFSTKIDNAFLKSFLNFLRYFSIFSLSVLGYYFCFNANFSLVLSACALGYLIQNMTNRLGGLIDYYNPLFDGISEYFVRSLLKMLLYYTIPYVVCFILFRNFNEYNQNDKRLNVISALVVLVTMVFTRVFDFMERENIYVTIAQLFLSLSSCLPLLLVYFVIYHNIIQEQRIVLTNHLLSEAKKEYENWKESIDIINAKAHDLKKMINQYDNVISQSSIDEINKAISTYDSSFKNGSEVLDMILYEKNNVCESNGISFIYMMDGELLSFMKNEDVYFLFTNIIDNAIEAVKKIDDVEKRVIHISLKKVFGAVVISEENYYSGEIKINADNRLITSKDDKNYHGFGILSIEQIVKKYNGNMSISHSKGLFLINIML